MDWAVLFSSHNPSSKKQIDLEQRSGGNGKNRKNRLSPALWCCDVLFCQEQFRAKSKFTPRSRKEQTLTYVWIFKYVCVCESHVGLLYVCASRWVSSSRELLATSAGCIQAPFTKLKICSVKSCQILFPLACKKEQKLAEKTFTNFYSTFLH